MGFIGSLLVILRAESPSHLAVCFDSRNSFRHDDTATFHPDARYKAGRGETDPELRYQIDLCRAACAVFQWRRVQLAGYEADDTLATLALLARRQDWMVTLCSADKDFIPLMAEGVRIWQPIKKEYLTTESVQKRWGVPPEKMGDMLRLVGDQSDNIPGIKGIGPVNATRLLAQHPSVDHILINSHLEKKPAIRTALMSAIGTHRLTHHLLSFDLQAPVSTDWVRYRCPTTVSSPQIDAFLEEHGLHALRKRVSRGNAKKGGADPSFIAGLNRLF